MDVNRVRATATAVVGFFGFLLPFLYVVSQLGGGLQGFALSVLIGGIVASIVYFVYPYFIGSSPREKDKPAAKPPTTPRAATYEAVCDPGPYDVEAGKPAVKVALSVQRGDTILGEVTEKENYKFNCYLTDSANYVKLVWRAGIQTDLQK